MASALLIMNGRRRRCIVQSAVGARTLNPTLVRRIETFGCTLTSLTRIAAPSFAVGESARLRRTECSHVRFSGSLIVGHRRLNAGSYVCEVCAPTGRRTTGSRRFVVQPMVGAPGIPPWIVYGRNSSALSSRSPERRLEASRCVEEQPAFRIWQLPKRSTGSLLVRPLCLNAAVSICELGAPTRTPIEVQASFAM
jgi:hypothetical protein